MNTNNLQAVLDEAYEYARGFIGAGRVATYIPELAKADPGRLGACLATPDGALYHAGQWDANFTIQSISKAVSLLLALQTAGYGEVFRHVGMEPSGDPFNSMAKLETRTPTPSNPFINAGAIVVVSCITCEDPVERALELCRRLCGNPSIACDEAVYQSEKSHGMRNRAMAYLMVSEGTLSGDVEQLLDRYFHMCSISMNCQDLARLGLVLACDGVDPVSGERLLDEWSVRITKSLMLTCGLYDSSGSYAVKVGVPSKSGVGGGILASVESSLGIGICGPALDEVGNSVGAQRMMEYLSHRLGLHLFQHS